MSEPFLGQIIMVGQNWPPRDYAQCDGLILPIVQNQSLYSLLGTTFGGDGRTNFALPDLRGRSPVATSGMYQGAQTGYESVTLSQSNLPSHTHEAMGTTNQGEAGPPFGSYPFGVALGADQRGEKNYSSQAATTPMSSASIGFNYGGAAHDNMQPSLVINFCIALVGVYPSRG